MKSRFTPCAAVLLAVVTAPAAVADPPSISRLADKAMLSDADRQEVVNYVEFWSRKLSAGEPQDVDAARDRLIDPLRAVQVGDGFRLEYARMLLPRLGPTVESPNAHAGVNAVQVMGMLGTPNSLELIMEHASVESEADFSIRLWTANMFPILVDQGVVTDNDVNRAMRQLQRAAVVEPDWLVLRRQFEAIASVKSDLSRDIQIEILDTIAAQMKQESEFSERMQAMYPALVRLRNEVIKLDTNQLETMGTALAPVLIALCTVADQHWESAQQNGQARAAYGGTVQISENLLKFIDANVRPRHTRLQTNLGPAWENQAKNQFNQDLAKCRQVLSMPPYANRR